MADAFERSRAGIGTVLVIEGPAGIGKTRLLDAFRGLAGEAGIQILAAQAAELEREVPFGVVAQLFAGVADSVTRTEMLSGRAGLAAPVLERRLDASPPIELPSVVTGLVALTANLAHTPLAMLVDDAQWADRPSLTFLAHLASRLECLGVVLAVAIRTGEEAPGRAGMKAIASSHKGAMSESRGGHLRVAVPTFRRSSP
jgi:predicted ATPase